MDNFQLVDVKVLECIPYQACPVCQGQGQILADGFTSLVYQVCPVCLGARIIPMHPIPPKNEKH